MRNQPHTEQSTDWQEERLTWPHHEASSFVQAAGIRWHVQRMGRGAPLMLVHGTGASTHSWRGVMPLLAQQFSVVAIDLPGHAFTDSLSAARTSIEGISAALAALLDTLNISPDFCVGHSAGAVILCKMALNKQIRPRRIVSANGAFLPLGGPAARLLAPLARVLANNASIARWMAPGARRAREVVARLIARTGSTLDEEGVELYARLVRKPGHVAGALRMMGNWRLHEFQASLADVAVPMTLLVGEHDLMVPPEQGAMVQRLVRQASVRYLEGLGHLAHEERPGLFADEVALACSER